MADVKFEVIRVSLPTSGTVDATISGFGTPSAAIFMAGEGAVDDTSIIRTRGSIGFKEADSSQWSVGFLSDEGGSVAQTARGHRNNGVITLQGLSSGTTPISFVAYSAARITDGYRLSILSGGTGLSRLCTVILIGGADVSNVAVGNMSLGASTSPVSETGLGFEPDLLFGSSVGLGGTGVVIGVENILSFGVAHNGASIEQACSNISGADNAATTLCNGYVSNSNFLAQTIDNSVSWTAAVTSFDAGGFTITPSASTSNDYMGYLAIKFSNSPDVKVKGVTIPASGNYAEAGIGFEPNFGLIALSAGPSSYNSIATSSTYALGLSAFDASSIFTLSHVSEDGLSTQDAASMSADRLRVLAPDKSDAIIASSYAFDADGWDFTLTTNPASAILGWGLAIGAGGGGTAVTSDGVLDSQSATMTGSFARDVTSSGTPESQSASMSGSAAREITSSSALESQEATISGSSEPIVVVTSSGSLASQSATSSGSASREVESSGDLQSQDAVIVGIIERIITSSGDMDSGSATILGLGPGVEAGKRQIGLGISIAVDE